MPDGQANRRFSREPSPWPAPATPYTFRTRIDTHGTLACAIANSPRAPRLIVPARSAAVPITNPGMSTKFTTGRWNWSHTSTKRAVFSAASPVTPPP